MPKDVTNHNSIRNFVVDFPHIPISSGCYNLKYLPLWELETKANCYLIGISLTKN